MPRDPIPKKNLRQSRLISLLIALFFGSLAGWMFRVGHDVIMACLFAGAALFALIDAIVGWRRVKD